jgi:hypothetical protein
MAQVAFSFAVDHGRLRTYIIKLFKQVRICNGTDIVS